MLKELVDWLVKNENTLDFGTISIVITKHEGQIAGVERSVIVKEKFNTKKKVEK